MYLSSSIEHEVLNLDSTWGLEVVYCRENMQNIERLKVDNMVRVNEIVTIFLIESSIHILDQNRYPVDTSLIHIESRKPPTAELFDVDSGRISIVIVNTKEYHSDVLAIITRIIRRTLDNSL
ncbi:hypothetical protein Tco_0540301 [Tanacetum coccineum]